MKTKDRGKKHTKAKTPAKLVNIRVPGLQLTVYVNQTGILRAFSHYSPKRSRTRITQVRAKKEAIKCRLHLRVRATLKMTTRSVNNDQE